MNLHPLGRDTLLPGRPIAPRTLFLGQAFLRGLATSVALTVYALYVVRDVGMTPLQLVLVGTGLEVAMFLGEIPTGIIADVYSRRLSVIIGLAVTAAGWAIIAAVPSFTFVLIGQIVWGIGATFGSGAREAWLADEVGEEAAAPLYLRAQQFLFTAHLVGIPLAVLLGGVSLRLAIGAGAVVHLLLAIGLLVGMTERGWRPAARRDLHSWSHLGDTLTGGVHAVRTSRTLLGIFVIALLLGASSEALDRLWPLHMIDDFTFPTIGFFDQVRWFGVIQGGVAIGAIAVTVAARRLTSFSSPASMARSLIVINALLMLAVLVFALSGAFWVALVAFWATDWVRAAEAPLRLAWINRGLDPRSRATVLSLFSQADAIGQIAGGPALGVVATLRGVRAALVGVALVLGPTLPLYRVLHQREERIAALKDVPPKVAA